MYGTALPAVLDSTFLPISLDSPFNSRFCGRYECELDLYAERQRGTKNAFNIFMTLKVLFLA